MDAVFHELSFGIKLLGGTIFSQCRERGGAGRHNGYVTPCNNETQFIFSSPNRSIGETPELLANMTKPTLKKKGVFQSPTKKLFRNVIVSK